MADNNVGINDYIIWNEPNNVGNPASPKFEYMPAATYAALLHRTWHTLREGGYAPNIWWGGIFTIPVGSGSQGAIIDYVGHVYAAVKTWKVNGNVAGYADDDYPWTGSNIHLHRERSLDDLQDLVDAFRQHCKRGRPAGNPGTSFDPVIVGEWGVTQGRPLTPPPPIFLPSAKADGPDQLRNAFDRLLSVDAQWTPPFEAMTYFSYARFDETATGWWGLQPLGTSGSGPGVHTLQTRDNFDAEMYDAYNKRLGE